MARLDPTGVSRILSYIKTWVTNALGGKANSSHNHTKSQITDFPTIPSSTSQLTNDSGFLTSHQSLANYVTLNTAQTISGNKTFSGLTKTSGKVGYDTAGNDVNNAIYNMETTTWGPDTANKPSSNYGTLLSLNREVNVHTSAGVGWIVQFGIGTDTRLYLRTKTNIGGDWSGWREFSDIGHTHTKSQITDFPTIPSNTSQLTNDSGYITSSGSCNYANSAGSVVCNVPAESFYTPLGGDMAANDAYRIRAGGTNNGGELWIETADDGNEPIGFAQYTGYFSSVARYGYLLNSSGDTEFPGTLFTSRGAIITRNGIPTPGWGMDANTQSVLQIRTTDNTEPSLCFHRSGYSHVVLGEQNNELVTHGQGGTPSRINHDGWTTLNGYRIYVG